MRIGWANVISVNNDWIGLHNVHSVVKPQKCTEQWSRHIYGHFRWRMVTVVMIVMTIDMGVKLLLCTVTCDNEKDYNPGNEPRTTWARVRVWEALKPVILWAILFLEPQSMAKEIGKSSTLIFWIGYSGVGLKFTQGGLNVVNRVCK